MVVAEAGELRTALEQLRAVVPELVRQEEENAELRRQLARLRRCYRRVLLERNALRARLGLLLASPN